MSTNVDSVDIAQARKSLAELVRRASEGELIAISRYGKPMAMLIGFDSEVEQMQLVNDVPGPADTVSPNTPGPESLRWLKEQEERDWELERQRGLARQRAQQKARDALLKAKK